MDEGRDDQAGLTLNEAKPSLRDAKTESFDFLGYTLGPKYASANFSGRARRARGRKYARD